MSRSAAIALALLVALVAVGCTSSGPTIDVTAADASANQARPELVSGRQALADAQGTPHILWFWAPS